MAILPYFLRNKTGSAAAYAFMLFPKHLNLDLSVYIKVIEDVILVNIRRSWEV